MKQLNPKLETFLHTVNILILLSLCISIYTNGQDLSCDKCSISFGHRTAYNEDYNSFNVSIMELYEPFAISGGCYVKFDRTDGYRRDEYVKEN